MWGVCVRESEGDKLHTGTLSQGLGLLTCEKDLYPEEDDPIGLDGHRGEDDSGG